MINYREFSLKDIEELPLGFSFWSVFILLFCIVFILSGRVFLWPLYTLLEESKRNEVQLKHAITKQYNDVATLSQLQASLNQSVNYYTSLTQNIFIDDEDDSFLSSVSRIGEKNKLRFQRIEWRKKRDENFLDVKSLYIEFVGQYDNLGSFSEDIANLPLLINFERFDIQKVDKDSPNLLVEIIANTYQLKNTH